MPTIPVEIHNSAISEFRQAFVVKNGSFRKKTTLIYPVILIHHPQGTVLLDAGIGTHIEAELGKGSWLYKLLQPVKVLSPIKKELHCRLDPSRDFFLITHAHWDHLSGAMDFPEMKVKLLREDFNFGTKTNKWFSFATIPWQLHQLEARIEFLELSDGPYRGFAKSLDLFRDGSLILVPLPGHTPGSFGVFLNGEEKTVFFVGDAVLTVDDDGFPQARSFLASRIFNYDDKLAKEAVEKITELKWQSKNLFIVPYHDPKAYRLCGYELGLAPAAQP